MKTIYIIIYLSPLYFYFIVSGAPIITQPSTLDFLRKYGYLEAPNNNASSDTLISQDRILQAVKVMQHFGGLDETGELDDNTIALMTKSRCGVTDVVAKDRNGRFALGSLGWNKRTLTYRLENLSPKLNVGQVQSDIQKVANLWGRYSQIKFRNVTRKRADDVDIAISFGIRDHGDSYPFDGLGGTLAHAFYPQNRPGISGDIHFDEEEQWAHSVSQGVSFLQVLAHEFGHSLGLAHSPRTTSIMFPYYKQDGDEEPKLDQDDIMALYHLYVSKDPEKTTPRLPKLPTTTNPPSTTMAYPITTPKINSDEHPNLCEIKYDAIAFLRNEIFVFYGQWMWRFKEKGQLLSDDYPAKFSRLFSTLEGVDKIDAAFEKGDDIVFISGTKYWTLLGSNEPRSITDFGLAADTNIDAAFVWGRNGMTYFFGNDMYWKYDEDQKKIPDGYPIKIQDRWRGLPDRISSVFTYRDGKTYFFRRGEVLRFDDVALKTEESYRQNVRGDWFGCSK